MARAYTRKRVVAAVNASGNMPAHPKSLPAMKSVPRIARRFEVR
jgi:hypothetical protein